MKRPIVSAVLAGFMALCSAGIAAAGSIVVNGSNFAYISQNGDSPFSILYNRAPSQGEIDPLMTFDVSAYAGEIGSNGSLTITDLSLCCTPPENQLTASLSLYSLTAPYDPGTATWSSVQSSGYPTAGDLLDTESYTINGGYSQVPVTFTVPQAILQGWANSPSTNYGVIVIESDTFTSDQGHSDIPYITAGAGAPTLAFTTVTPEPESLELVLLGIAAAGLILRSAKRVRE